MHDLVLAKNLKKLLDTSRGAIQKALPRHLTVNRMTSIALTECRKTPELYDCDTTSFLGAIIQASQLGLEPGGALGHCYLLPFKNQKKGITEVQFIIGYRGMIDLALRSDRVSHVIARAVHEGDFFEWQFGTDEKIEHKPRPSKDKKITHVYAVVFLKSGGKVFDVMDISDVEDIRERSKAKNFGPWKTDFEAMAKKSVVRRLFKFTPVSIEIQKSIGLDELAEAGESQDNADVIEASFESVNETQQPATASARLAAEFAKPVAEKDTDPNSFANFTGGPNDPQMVK